MRRHHFSLLALAIFAAPAFAGDAFLTAHPRLREIMSRPLGSFQGTPFTLKDICGPSSRVRDAVQEALRAKVTKLPPDADAFDFLHAASRLSYAGPTPPDIAAVPDAVEMFTGTFAAECRHRLGPVVRAARTELEFHDWGKVACELREKFESHPDVEEMQALSARFVPKIVALLPKWAAAAQALKDAEPAQENLRNPDPARRVGTSLRARFFADNAEEVRRAITSLDLQILPPPEGNARPLWPGEFRVRTQEAPGKPSKNFRLLFSRNAVTLRPDPEARETLTTLSPHFLRRWGINPAPTIRTSPRVVAGFSERMNNQGESVVRADAGISLSIGDDSSDEPPHDAPVGRWMKPSEEVKQFVQEHFLFRGLDLAEREFIGRMGGESEDPPRVAERVSRVASLLPVPARFSSTMAEPNPAVREQKARQAFAAAHAVWKERESVMARLSDRMTRDSHDYCDADYYDPTPLPPPVLPEGAPRVRGVAENGIKPGQGRNH